MGIEIERKFLVRGDAWKQGEVQRLSQGYLNKEKSRTVRVRITDEQAFLTIKGKTAGLTRSEFEYPIPIADAEEMLLLCGDATLQKNRYVLPVGDLIWEIDEFLGANQGLVVAEVELISETQHVELPDWVGQEVSGDARYYNSSLVQLPYSRW